MVVASGQLTDEDKRRMALQAEIECDRLRRQCTLLEGDRFRYVQGKDRTILRQKRVLRVYQNDHNNVVTDLNVATTLEKKRQDRRNIDNVQTQLNHFDHYQMCVDRTKIELREIEGQIKMVTAAIYRLGKQDVSDWLQDERLRNDQQSLRLTENRLQIETRKFCVIADENRKLRELIEHLLYERRDFMKIWSKLIGKLNTGKKFMLDIIEQATIAADQREEWCRKLHALRMKAHKDLLMHTELMCNFQRKQDNDTKLGMFLLVKNQRRVTRDYLAKLVEKTRVQRENLEEQLKTYKHMQSDIMEFTGETNIEMIAKKFAKQEIENFAYFKFINDLNDEVENIDVYLSKLLSKNEQKKTYFDTRNQDHEDKVINLVETLANMQQKTESLRQELEAIQLKLWEILENISALFQRSQCRNEKLNSMLGDNAQINIYNVIAFLEILEDRIHSISLVAQYGDKITAHDKHKKHSDHKLLIDDYEEMRILPVKDIVGTNPCPLCVEHEYVSDVVDALQKPLTRQEAKDKLLQRLSLPDGLERLHNVSDCHLPKSREIIQRRYQ